MLLGYNSNGLTSHRLDDALRLLADEGFQAVAWTPDVGHLDPLTISTSEIDALAKLLDELGLACVVESGARFLLDPRRKHRPNLLENDATGRVQRLALYEKHLEIAEAIGARALSLWSGSLPRDVPADLGRARLKAGLEALLEIAEERQVPLAFEAEPGMLLETVAEVLDLRQELGEPELFGLTLDIGHLYVTAEGLPADIIPGLGELLLQVHVEDMRHGIHEHLPPGEGDVDFAAVWASLEAVEYSGPVCWELSRSAHAAPEMLRRARWAFEAPSKDPA